MANAAVASCPLANAFGAVLSGKTKHLLSSWKESFASAATAAKTLAKKQAEALSTEESALGKIKSQLTASRVK
jgi:hypothetical protein